MLLILAFFRVCIFRAVRRGHFERWMGPPLLLMYVTYVISQYALSM
jgi:cation:H+ antiporter